MIKHTISQGEKTEVEVVIADSVRSLIIKYLKEGKENGFISQEGGSDVFVHFSAIQTEGYRTLDEGQKVEFSTEKGPKGLQAVQVTPL